MSHEAATAPEAVKNLLLQGKRVLVTRPYGQARDLVDRLAALGAVPLALPTIRILPPDDQYAALDAALRRLATFDWAIFTSVNGVTHVWQRLAALNLPAESWQPLRLAAIGPATADALAGRGLRVTVVPERYVAESLLAAIPAPHGKRFLLPRAAGSRDVLHQGLLAAGAEVVEVHAYRTVPADLTPEARLELERGVDIVTFTSSSTVQNLVVQMGLAQAQTLVARAIVVAIGPITAQTAHELGLRVDRVASEYTMTGLLDALLAASG